MSSKNTVLDLDPRLVLGAKEETPEISSCDAQAECAPFKQSLIISTSTAGLGILKPRWLVLSLLFHLALIGLIVMAPVIWPGSLHYERQLLAYLIEPPSDLPLPLPPSSGSLKQTPSSTKVLRVPKGLLTPAEIPAKIPKPSEHEITDISEEPATGVPGGVPGGVIALQGAAEKILEDMPDKTPLNKHAYRVGEGVVPPVLVSSESPPYTEDARKAKIQGLVVLEAVINRNGLVEEIKVIKGLGYGLDRSAIENVKDHWHFKPGMKDGLPVDVIVTIKIFFELH